MKLFFLLLASSFLSDLVLCDGGASGSPCNPAQGARHAGDAKDGLVGDGTLRQHRQVRRCQLHCHGSVVGQIGKQPPPLAIEVEIQTLPGMKK